MSGAADPNLPVMVVEDGTMPLGANSYVTTAYASAYIAANQHIAPQWEALASWQQNALLMWATKYIDQRATWNGVPTSQYLNEGGNAVNFVAEWPVVPQLNPVVQSLRWPRYGVYDIDTTPIQSNVVPRQVQEATVEMARYNIGVDLSMWRPQDGLTEIRADVVTIKFDSNYTLPSVPDHISFIIRGIGTISSGRTFGAKIRRN